MHEKPDLKIDWATHEAAKYACENWHYSKAIPAGKLVKIGVWENSKFIGVVLFSRGASAFLLDKYQISQNEGCELTRVALRSHRTPVSRIMKLAFLFLKKACEGLKLVVSFADPSEGHHGGIYQAGNWIYTGKSNSTIEYFLDNRWQHVRNSYYKKTDSTPTRTREGKHRYIMPLTNEMKSKIEHLAKPYPKRVTKAPSEFPSDSGGAVPTHALQL
jgi:hypothetical protein